MVLDSGTVHTHEDSLVQNVYIVHHAATSTQSPMIGLMGLTDASSSIQNFRVERGNDPNGPVPVLTNITPRAQGLSAVAICGIAAAAGFVFGILLTAIMSLFLGSKTNKY